LSVLPFSKVVLKIAPDLGNDTRRVDFFEVLKGVERGNYSYRWKSAGCAWGHDVIEGAASPAPSKIIPSKFADVLDPVVPGDRYFLTSNAAAGIVRRADTVGRTLFSPMRKALDIMASSCDKPDDAPRETGDAEWRAQLSSA
jgi:DNA (cytosine-5)-methyltransferase 1